MTTESQDIDEYAETVVVDGDALMPDYNPSATQVLGADYDRDVEGSARRVRFDLDRSS